MSDIETLRLFVLLEILSDNIISEKKYSENSTTDTAILVCNSM